MAFEHMFDRWPPKIKWLLWALTMGFCALISYAMQISCFGNICLVAGLLCVGFSYYHFRRDGSYRPGRLEHHQDVSATPTVPLKSDPEANRFYLPRDNS